MAFYHASLTYIDISEVKRYAGIANDSEFPKKLLQQACNSALAFAVPRGSWNIYSYNSAEAVIYANQPLALTGNSIKSHLHCAEQVAVLAVTIGTEIEQQIANEFSQGNYTAGLLLDAAATAAVECLADQIDKVIAQQARQQGYFTLPRFSPGYGDWKISVQPRVLALAGGSNLDIHVNEADMLLPRKSITAVIGFTANSTYGLERAFNDSPCLKCKQPHCLSRKD